MGVQEITQIIVGILLVFFIPGILIMYTWMRKYAFIEKLIYGVLISIGIAIMLGLILGYLGLFTITAVFITYGIILLGLGSAHLFFRK